MDRFPVSDFSSAPTTTATTANNDVNANPSSSPVQQAIAYDSNGNLIETETIGETDSSDSIDSSIRTYTFDENALFEGDDDQDDNEEDDRFDRGFRNNNNKGGKFGGGKSNQRFRIEEELAKLEKQLEEAEGGGGGERNS